MTLPNNATVFPATVSLDFVSSLSQFKHYIRVHATFNTINEDSHMMSNLISQDRQI